MGRSNLGDYLRARRARLQPEHVGLPANARRRVKGLRREEVAMLAGISPEYYLRLEQGRDLHPSDQVLAGLARALCLDADATSYLHVVAKPRTVPTRRPRSEKVGPHMASLIDGWPHTAAYVQGHGFTVLASNRLAAALSPHFAEGANPLRAAFLSPDMQTLYRDWEAMTAKAVPFLRSVVAGHEDDPRVTNLVADLSMRSERFRTLWAKHDVKVRDEGLTQLHHPQVGSLDLRFQKFVLPESEQLLVTYHAEPGGPSDDAFRKLAAFASGADDPAL